MIKTASPSAGPGSGGPGEPATAAALLSTVTSQPVSRGHEPAIGASGGASIPSPVLNPLGCSVPVINSG